MATFLWKEMIFSNFAVKGIFIARKIKTAEKVTDRISTIDINGKRKGN